MDGNAWSALHRQALRRSRQGRGNDREGLDTRHPGRELLLQIRIDLLQPALALVPWLEQDDPEAFVGTDDAVEQDQQLAFRDRPRDAQD